MANNNIANSNIANNKMVNDKSANNKTANKAAVNKAAGSEPLINEPIAFEWRFEWQKENMGGAKPVINRLLRAIILGKADEIGYLFNQGATIDGMDELTLKRALYETIENYNVLKGLIDNGLCGLYSKYEKFEVLDPAGSKWGILARAWRVKNYRVMDLLARYGFNQTVFHVSGKKTYQLEEQIVRTNDVEAMAIMLKYGHPREEFEKYKETYPKSEVTALLESHPVIKIETMAMNEYRFKQIPKPELEKATIFNVKQVEQRNSVKIKNYNNQVEAQKNLKKNLGADWDKYASANQRANKAREEYIKNKLLQ